MRLLAISTLLLAAAPAAPLCAQARFSLVEATVISGEPRSGLSFRITEDIAPDGSSRQRRGILAGVNVARKTIIGLGFFDSAPKMRGPGFESRIDSFTKRSRKAAVGMSFRF